jgi:hypothetical protein
MTTANKEEMGKRPLDLNDDSSSEEPPMKKQKTDTSSSSTTQEQKKEHHFNRILEMGHIFFLYRPRSQLDQAEDIVDVQRLYLLLKPFVTETNKSPTNRLIIVGKKKLPDVKTHERYWAFVDYTSLNIKEIVDNRLEIDVQTNTEGVRPCGEGLYCIARHDRGSELAYILELPEKISEVQKAFNIVPEATYNISVKNPKGSDGGFGLPDDQKAELPETLQKKFGNRKWLPLNPPEFLDYAGVELLLIGSSPDIVAELGDEGIKFEEESERDEIDINSLYQELRMKKEQHPVDSIIKGTWA